MAGYIGTTPVPQATQHRESFTATGGQTSFATVGYTPQFIDVYLNGVKLAPADFTATNGSDVVLASGATASDILEIVAYTPFEVANQTFTGTTTAANLTVTGAFTSQGIDDNADAVAITIDSSENVGIGTSSPSSYSSAANNLVVQDTAGEGGITIVSTNTGSSNIFFADTDAAAQGQIKYQHSGDYMRFYTAASEAMRIDSSGNLLVGQSSTALPGAGNSTTGISVSGQYDALFISRSSGSSGVFNRNSDGDILEFRKDGATVGSIGTRSGSIGIGNGDVGLEFNASNNDIYPKNVTTNSLSDANIDLGSGSYRFKDLYLSGGVYLGGTGSANKLEDYESGTWTPTLVGSSSGSCTVSANAVYTKVGRVVIVHGYLDVSSVGSASGNLVISNLPFSIAGLIGSTSLQASGTIGYYAGFATGVNSLSIMAQTSFSGFSIRGLTSSTAGGISDLNSTHVGTGDFRFSITYFTT